MTTSPQGHSCFCSCQVRAKTRKPRASKTLSEALEINFGVIAGPGRKSYSKPLKCRFVFLSFNRQKSGFLGWGGDKTENIHGYEAKVYSVSGVEVITRTRTEHMSEEDREQFKGNALVFIRYLILSFSMCLLLVGR